MRSNFEVAEGLGHLEAVQTFGASVPSVHQLGFAGDATSANMFVKKLASNRQKAIWHVGQRVFRQPDRPPWAEIPINGRGISPIREYGSHATPSIFKGSEPRVIPIRAAQVKLRNAFTFSFLNCPPE